MRRVLWLISFPLLAISVPAVRAGDKAPTEAELRKAVERSLPYLEKEGNAWIKKYNCLSCHHVPFMLWSHNEAAARGFAVDRKKLADWSDWAATSSLSLRAWYKVRGESMKALAKDEVPEPVRTKIKTMADKPFTTEADLIKELGKVLTPDELTAHQAALVKHIAQPKKGGQNDGGGLDTLAQLLLGRAQGAPAGKMTDFLAEAPALMIRWQEADGSWHCAGQNPDRRWTKPAANQVTTLWAVLALATLEKPDAATTQSLKIAQTFLKEAKPATNHEGLVASFLVEKKFGDKTRADEILKDLLKRQNADGGWSWQPGEPSDAYCTGQSLYALAGQANEEAIRKAQQFLLKTQTDDGAWLVSPKNLSAANTAIRLQKLEPIYRYWGTAWATIGLVRALPEAKKLIKGSARCQANDLGKGYFLEFSTC